MAAELGLPSLTQLQKLAEQQQLGTGVWQWAGNRHAVEEDDSWEVRAFAEDTGSALGTTWPPRSYTCAFCRREFRSAQALGGHMNVHRRDRARLRQGSDPSPSSVTTSPPILLSSPEFVTANGALCLFYPIAPHGTVFAPAIDSSSTLLSVAPYTTGNGLVSPPMAINFPSVVHGDASPSLSDNLDSMRRDGEVVKDNKDDVVVEELDLELRLGW